MAVNPPVYLSEDEARQVIQEEAKKAGLEFSADAATTSMAIAPVADHYWCQGYRLTRGLTGEQVRGTPSGGHALTLDGVDPKRHVAYEFVSRRDYIAFQSKDPGCVIPKSPSSMAGAAEAPRQTVRSSDATPWVGVFYDLGARPSLGAQAQPGGPEKAGQELGAEQLRKQVRDFIQWLTAQGVI
jgi:hypothetical protein